jgi:dimeric dUTPase (all-alpha-NTP-PPase superfamily)
MDRFDEDAPMPVPPVPDRFEEMFRLREEFMHALSRNRPGAQSEWPLDLRSKESQRNLRDVSLRGVEEVFEALNHLKNWKPHRKTEMPDFDRDKFLEEWVDAMNYFFSVLILAGFTPHEIYESYVEKDRVIHERLRSDY